MTFDPKPWLSLLHTSGVGPATGRRLLDIVNGDAAKVLDLQHNDLLGLGISDDIIRALRQPDEQAIEQDLSWLEKPNRHLLPLGHADYPSMLAKITDPPLMLFVAGEPAVLSHPQIAVVGSRNPTAQGRENAAAFAHFLAEAGFAITSGMARGIDEAAHRGALQSSGLTVAVCGTGLGTVYPTQHRQLAGEIAACGALVSEFSTGTEAHKSNFPRRNRIISGLAVGTLVIEAAQRSGSLITARLSGEQGREIFAVPGSIHNPMARGCHRLIREGARLVESGADIIEELGNLTRTTLNDNESEVESPDSAPELSSEYLTLLDSLGVEPCTIDQLCSRTGLTANEVSSMLLILELQGYVVVTDGGRYLRT